MNLVLDAEAIRMAGENEIEIRKGMGFTNIEELDRKSYGNLDPDGKRIEMFSITVRGYK